jgi:hypothetical protein
MEPYTWQKTLPKDFSFLLNVKKKYELQPNLQLKMVINNAKHKNELK